MSSGCIYSGAKVATEGQTRVERDLTKDGLPDLLKKNRGAFHGFTESDEPNFTFRRPAVQFLQRDQGPGGGIVARRGPGLRLAAADSF